MIDTFHLNKKALPLFLTCKSQNWYMYFMIHKKIVHELGSPEVGIFNGLFFKWNFYKFLI